jgi:Homeodomain-like domain
MPWFPVVSRLVYVCKDLLSEALGFLPLMARSQASLAAEILFLRKQLAFYQEHKIKPRRFDDAARLSMLLFSKFFDWKKALINVKPDTFTGWHKKAFQLFWRWKSRGGRPRLPRNIQQLIVEMAINNPTWGQKRVADELSLKLGILVSPRTVKKYWPEGLNAKEGLVSALENVCTQSRQCSGSLRFCYGRDSNVPQTLRAGRHGDRHAENPALQCDRTSHGRMDGTAVPRSDPKRSLVSVPDA